MTNCKNCGGPLKENKCPYCGSEYEFIQELNDFQQIFKVKIGNELRRFYISSVQFDPVFETYRDLSGRYEAYLPQKDNIRLELVSYD